MSDNTTRPMPHNYDGIQEYNNRLPNWWLQIFWITIVFSVGYAIYYHIAHWGSSSAELFDQMEAREKQQNLTQSPPPPQDYTNVDFNALMADKRVMDNGATIYKTRCAACHTDTGAGNIGPNLTDDYWMYGGSFEKIAKTIAEGIPEKGMIAWKAVLSKEEILAVTIYTRSLHGTHPANPKPPQGDKEVF